MGSTTTDRGRKPRVLAASPMRPLTARTVKTSTVTAKATAKTKTNAKARKSNKKDTAKATTTRTAKTPTAKATTRKSNKKDIASATTPTRAAAATATIRIDVAKRLVEEALEGRTAVDFVGAKNKRSTAETEFSDFLCGRIIARTESSTPSAKEQQHKNKHRPKRRRLLPSKVEDIEYAEESSLHTMCSLFHSMYTPEELGPLLQREELFSGENDDDENSNNDHHCVSFETNSNISLGGVVDDDVETIKQPNSDLVFCTTNQNAIPINVDHCDSLLPPMGGTTTPINSSNSNNNESSSSESSSHRSSDPEGNHHGDDDPKEQQQHHFNCNSNNTVLHDETIIHLRHVGSVVLNRQKQQLLVSSPPLSPLAAVVAASAEDYSLIDSVLDISGTTQQ